METPLNPDREFHVYFRMEIPRSTKPGLLFSRIAFLPARRYAMRGTYRQHVSVRRSVRPSQVGVLDDWTYHANNTTPYHSPWTVVNLSPVHTSNNVEATLSIGRNFTIESFDFVAVCGNKVECFFDKVERCFDNVACCFDIVAGVDGALVCRWVS